MSHLLTSLHDFAPEWRGGGVSVGNFDGVHLGHARLISRLVAAARRVGGPAVVMTFDPPPVAILHPGRRLKPPLTTMRRRAELLYRLGVDIVIAYPTDAALLSLSAKEFFQQKIVQALGARAMVEGPNFHFGRDREGGTELLRLLCQAGGLQLEIVEATMQDSGMVSSTRIRQLLGDGRIADANQLMTQPYRLRGRVVAGARRGRELGFPTANLAEIPTLVPARGVYAGRASADGRSFAAAVNIGPNPTFAEMESKVEVHLIDYAGPELYDQHLQLTLLERIRAVVKFESVEQLLHQVQQDIVHCRARAALESE